MEQEIQLGYERNMNHTYLVCYGAINETDYEMQMILNNQIPGVLANQLNKVDGEVKLYYEISSKQPLNRIYEKKKMDYEALKTLLWSMQKVILKMEEYLLPMEYLITNPEMIYVDLEKSEYYFCLIPKFEEKNVAIQSLMEFLLECVDYADEVAVAAAYECYKKIGEDNASFLQIFHEVFEAKNPEIKVQKKAIEKIENTKEGQEKLVNFLEAEEDEEEGKGKEDGNKKDTKGIIAIFGIAMIAAVGSVVAIILDFQRETMGKVLVAAVVAGTMIGYLGYKRRYEDGEEADFLFETEIEEEEGAETEIESLINTQENVSQELSSISVEKNVAKEAVYGETVFFQNPQINGCRRLEPFRKQFPDFIMELFPFVIGKLEGAVDGVIEDSTISRIHCKIEFEEGIYYIMDLNSTNGTVVNGSLLNANEKVVLQMGDEIQLGQVQYTFI